MPASIRRRSPTPLCRRSLTVAAALALSGCIVAPAAAAPAAPTPSATVVGAGSIGLRLLDAPIAARDDPRARIYIVDRMAPGAVILRHIAVTNTTPSVAHVLLYGAAASLANGAFLGAAGHTVNELSSWTSVQPGVLTVPAGGQAIAMVSLAIPRTASPGERYGVVWAQVTSASRPNGGVVQVSRVGVRMYVSVGSGGAPAANFVIASLTAERTADGRPIVVAAVRNTGGRALDMSGSLRLSGGPGGLGAGPFPAALGTTLAIGDTEPVAIALDKQLPAGPWNVEITLRSGLVEHQARATLTFPATGAAQAVPITPPRGHWLLPLLTGFAGLSLLALVLRGAIARRRRHDGRPSCQGPRHAAPSSA